MSSKKASDEGVKLIAANRKAHHDYFIVEKLETGIQLAGSELRPCRENRVNLKDAYVDIDNGEMWLIGVHIGLNPFSNIQNHDPERKRKLLAHRYQIDKFGKKSMNTGMTVIPLRMYFKQGKVKVEIALAKGKTTYDKRDSIAKKDMKRDMDRELKARY
ncbi:MAG: SsrA-binding protein SmpB [Candidatus Riflebacteria bacterium]|nr:SsrA-binding protein SmpB [Candidatus Riflebacteria bacterium]